jgi:hypothetical protein
MVKGLVLSFGEVLSRAGRFVVSLVVNLGQAMKKIPQ